VHFLKDSGYYDLDKLVKGMIEKYHAFTVDTIEQLGTDDSLSRFAFSVTDESNQSTAEGYLAI